MLSSSSINKLLNDPQHITAADEKDIDEMVNKYPYFLVGRYLQTAGRHKKKSYTAAQIAGGRLYTGNWLLYKEFLARVSASEKEPINEKMAIQPEQAKIEPVEMEQTETLIQPVYTEDYFLHQGEQVSEQIPAEIEELGKPAEIEEDPAKSLMVVMSFAEWLAYFKTKKQKDEEEKEDKKALRTMWQKEKLAAALEEENEEIPEEVFKMAVDSLSSEDDLASESLADIHYKQGKYDKAIDMYRKLSLRNPQKKIYFARRIEEILKEKQS